MSSTTSTLGNSKTIHVLGAGNVAALVATALTPVTDDKIVLILRSQARLQNFIQNHSQLTVYRQKAGYADYTEKFPAVVAGDQSIDSISTLIVTTKVNQTSVAIKPLVPFISPNTNILLLQNGVGSYEKLCHDFWPDAAQRPNFAYGIVSHGIKDYTSAPWSFVHAGDGTIRIGVLPGSESAGMQSLIDSLLKTDLHVEQLQYHNLLIAQYEKLIINAVVNSLTSIYDVPNGLLSQLPTALVSQEVYECCHIIRTYLESVLDENERALVMSTFNSQRMMRVVEDTFVVTARNCSSMRKDVNALHDTEVDFINGHLVDLAQKLKLHAPTNKMLVEMVKAKLIYKTLEEQQKNVPFENDV